MPDGEYTFEIMAGVSASAALYYYLKDRRRQKEIDLLLKEIEKHKETVHHLEIENASTKLNPHLLKNTLNTIYSFSYQTTTAIEKLSAMLSYILHESNKKYVTLNEELEFLEAYYQVHKLKLAPHAKVKFHVAEDSKVNHFKIAPLITINFIENAFVHGDYTLSDSELNITVTLENNTLHYSVSNTFSPSDKTPGIGYQNFKKRLELLHKNGYEISAQPDNKTFTASLKLRLHEN